MEDGVGAAEVGMEGQQWIGGACCNSFFFSFSAFTISGSGEESASHDLRSSIARRTTLLYSPFAAAAAACISFSRSFGSPPFHRSTPCSSIVSVGRPNCSMM
jgi:hypothetical protein